jgi:O-antigen/teichoic acid export membrane protein
LTLERNIFANYASQIYVTAVGIVMVPLYIKYMGAEAYGLVGFFAMLQAWFNLLDMGLSPTISRESARFAGSAITALEYRRMARAVEGLFAGIALIGGVLLFVLAEPMATRWLNVKALSISETVNCLRLMAVIVALRWVCGFYRGVISGAERLVWLSGLNSAIATGRFVLVLPVLIYVSASPWVFFSFQLLVAIAELAALAWTAYRLLPTLPEGEIIQWAWAPIQPVLKFALSIAFTSSVWVLVTQTDKLLLSKILPLEDYGYFTVAVLLASGIMMMSSPISGALMPRMARLQAEGKHAEQITLYRRSTQMVAVAVLPIAVVLALFAQQVLWVWTADAALVSRAAPALTLYAIGYGFLAVSAFPYYLQYANGDLRMHLFGNLLFVILLIPSVILTSQRFGIIGAGWTWMLLNIVYFFLWIPLVHKKMKINFHKEWLTIDIAWVGMPALLVGLLANYYLTWSSHRAILAAQIAIFTVSLIAVSYANVILIRKNENKIRD